MTWRAYSSGNDIIPGKWCAGQRGLGVLAETVPSSGTSGAGILLGPPSSLVFPADNGIEVRAELVTPPGSGTLQLFDDSTAIYANPTPGVYPMVFKYWRAGVDQGNATAYFVIGESCALAAVPQLVFSGNTGVGGAYFSGLVNALVFSGGSQTSPFPSCALAGAVNALAFAGNAGTAPSASLSGVVSGLSFAGGAVAGLASSSLEAAVNYFSFGGSMGHPFDFLSPTQLVRSKIDFTVLPAVRLVDQLAAKDPAETVLLECYFDLPEGVSLAGGVFVASVETSGGVTPDVPLEFLDTARTYGPRVQQLVRGGTNLNRYRIRCTANSVPTGLVMVQTGILPVVSQ